MHQNLSLTHRLLKIAIYEVVKNGYAMFMAISIKQVAEYFGVSVRTIRKWMESDENFPRAFKKFGTLRFRQSEIEEYWTKNQRKRKHREITI